MPTYTIYPSAGGSGTAVDGGTSRTLAPSSESWSTIHAGTGLQHNDTSTTGITAGFSVEQVTTNKWNDLLRAVILFDTSVIPAGSVVSSATVSLWPYYLKNHGEYTTKFDIYTSAPASNSSLSNADFTTFGTQAQTNGPITLANAVLEQYNDWTFAPGTGQSNIVPGGITKFGLRERTFDANNVSPTWSSTQNGTYFNCYSADNGSKKPMLVVVAAQPPVNYNFAPSGGIALGGSAATVITVAPVYTVVPSGGVALGGSIAIAVTSTPVPTGGIVLGGVITLTPIAGIVLGGSVTQNRVTDATPSAGVVLGGSTTLTRATDVTPTGGLVLGGSVTSARTLALTESGGVVLGGVAVRSEIEALPASGGIILGGSCVSVRLAPVTLTVRLFSGGVEIASWSHSLTGQQARVSWAGLQVPLVTGIAFVSGGIVLGGSAVVTYTAALSQSGGLVLGGAVTDTRLISYAQSDGIVLGGSCTTTLAQSKTITGVRAAVSSAGKAGVASLRIGGSRGLVSVVGKPGVVKTAHAVVGTRAVVSVVGKPGGFPVSRTILGTRALVTGICSPIWGCGVRILFPTDSEDLFLEAEDSPAEVSLDLVPSVGSGLDPMRSSCS